MSAASAPAYDAVVVGGGPAGAVCAAYCAAAGLRTLVLERAIFPREKVCGDCLNPACWPILRQLDLKERVLELPHARLGTVDFVDQRGRRLSVPIGGEGPGEIAVKRSHLDQVLLRRAAELGAEVREGATVTQVRRDAAGGWRIETEAQQVSARWLVAADGRNSTVARLLNLLPAARKDRVGQQTHFPLPAGAAGRVTMRFLREGYSGVADVGGGEGNLCLVARPERLGALKEWAAAEFGLGAGQPWRTITPLARRPAPAAGDRLLLAGDAARVVEPFTGEGIYYAMASGELAAAAIAAGDGASYANAHRRLYRGRLWINDLARLACLHPSFASGLLSASRAAPRLLAGLTRMVTGGERRSAAG